MNKSYLESPEISEFLSSAVLRDSLREELKLPGIAAALSAIASAVEIRSIPGPIPGNHPDTAIAHQYYRAFGVQQVLNTLKVLSMEKGKRHPLEHEPMVGEFTSTMDPRFRDPLPPGQREPDKV